MTALDSAGTARASTVTDASGGFSLPGLPPGRYELRVEADGFEPAHEATEVLESGAAAVSVSLRVRRVREAVTVTAEDSYVAPRAEAAKVETTLFELPQSVQVVPRAVIEDQGAMTLQETTKNVAGVTGAFGFFGVTNECVRVRGFSTEQGSVGCTYYRDGVRMWAQPISLTATEAVEVVKGPNTVLFGRNEPGGMINLVPKRPGDKVLSVEQTFGSFGTSLTSVDVGGPLNASRSLLARLNAGYLDTNTFRDRAFETLANVNAAVAWAPGDRTRVDLSVDYSRQRYQPDFGLPALGDRPAPVPVTQSYKQDYIDSKTASTVVQADFVHRFGSTFRLRVAGLYLTMEPNYFNVYGYGLDEETLLYPVYYFAEQFSERRTRQAVADLTGEVRAFGLTHRVLVGTDYFNERYDGPIFFSDAAPPLDLFDPEIGSAPQVHPGRDEYEPYGSLTHWWGFYVQDQVRLGTRWLLNAGLRHDRSKDAFSPDPVADAVAENATKPRFGILFEPRPRLALYAQYQEAFGPNNGRSSAGEAFPGQTAKQIEVGAKWATEGQRFLATLALFDLRKERLLTADLTTPDLGDSIAVGEVRNRGIELDLSGRLGRASVIASYGYSDAATVQDNNGFEGNRYEGVPRHHVSVWVRSQVRGGLSAGLGVFGETERPGDLGNTFSLPGYVRLDAMAQYRFRVRKSQVTVQLNVDNALDTEWYAGVYRNSRDFIMPGTPRRFQGSVRFDLWGGQ